MKIIQSNFGTIKVIDPVVPDARTTAQGTYGKYAAQIASGGRVKYQGAGLVDHGPEGVRQGYAVNWTPEKKANLKTWMDNTGSTLEDYNKLPYNTRSNIRFGRITGIKQTAEFGKQKEIRVVGV